MCRLTLCAVLLCAVCVSDAVTTDIDPRVSLGSMPFSWNVRELAETHGVTHVVNMCSEFSGPQREYARYGIKQLRLPSPDNCPISIQSVDAALQFIAAEDDSTPSTPSTSAQPKKPKHIFVHCKAGMGRSATVVLCWILHSRRAEGLTVADAFAHIKSKRHEVASDGMFHVMPSEPLR